MMLEERLRMLRDMPILGGVRDDVLVLIQERTVERRLAACEVLFEEGEPGEAVYLIEDGEVVAIRHRDHADYPLNRLRSGDSVGEMSFIDMGPRSATVIAVVDTKLLELSHDTFLQLYRQDMEQFALIQMNMAREMSRRLRAADDLRCAPGDARDI
jgi:CRP/FNR family cyclic AMP-dependent transcriptional regulator